LTPAQVMIRWCLQRGTIVIPKSTTPARIEENARLGDAPLSGADLAALDALDEYFVSHWDPTTSP
jgi:diketogulonate reductase-like aldo/keto reductase